MLALVIFSTNVQYARRVRRFAACGFFGHACIRGCGLYQFVYGTVLAGDGRGRPRCNGAGFEHPCMVWGVGGMDGTHMAPRSAAIEFLESGKTALMTEF